MIDSPRSAVVRRVRALHQKQARSETGLVLCEGPQVVRELIRHRVDLAVELYLTTAAHERYADLAAEAIGAGVEVDLASEEALAGMADTRTPQGIVAVARQAPVALRDVVDADTRLVVLLDEVRDPGNAGTIIRAADSSGAEAVLLTGTSVDPYNPKVVRATTGSLFHLAVSTGITLAAAVGAVRAAGMQVLVADMAGEPLPSLGEALIAPTAWIFGNEAHGVSAEARALADRVVAVPIYGAAESLNLATAASVCLYASAFAQHH